MEVYFLFLQWARMHWRWAGGKGVVHISSAYHIATDAEGIANSEIPEKQAMGGVMGGAFFAASHDLPTLSASKVDLIMLIRK